jgi:SAM-dependent methyltransferase
MTPSKIKRLLRAATPRWAQEKWATRSANQDYRDKTPAAVFGRIYREKHWGGPDYDFYSGSGSYVPDVIDPYVSAVRAFLSELPAPTEVVDIGCGDFTAAARIADLARHYHACDVVSDLIDRNRRLFPSPHVTFHRLDATVDALPHGDVVIVKQMFQHLSNEHISAVLPKLSCYPVWIVSEHVPLGSFKPNRDIQTGGYTRLLLNSAVVLTERPFRIRPSSVDLLCEVVEDGHPIQTLAYRF